MDHASMLDAARAIGRRRQVPLRSAAVRERCLEMARRGFVRALPGSRRLTSPRRRPSANATTAGRG